MPGPPRPADALRLLVDGKLPLGVTWSVQLADQAQVCGVQAFRLTLRCCSQRIAATWLTRTSCCSDFLRSMLLFWLIKAHVRQMSSPRIRPARPCLSQPLVTTPPASSRQTLSAGLLVCAERFRCVCLGGRAPDSVGRSVTAQLALALLTYHHFTYRLCRMPLA
jgi:hypothetical protein